MSKKPTWPKGKLIIIGGREQKSSDKDRPIVDEVAKVAAKGRLVVVTAATHLPEEVWEDYRKVFKELGVKRIDLLDIRTREDALDPANVKKLTDDAVVFFTGGDQLRITSQVGDSALFQRMHELYDRGGTVCGTSAGAAAMPETMLVAGPGDESGRISALEMAPGLGLVNGVVIDSHFAERGRMGRLLGAVAQNPKNIGLGIDEDTAVVLNPSKEFRVLGKGGVYVIDARHLSQTNIWERNSGNSAMSGFGFVLHVLSEDDRFDLRERVPIRKQPRAA